jgi:hypothetical protein
MAGSMQNSAGRLLDGITKKTVLSRLSWSKICPLFRQAQRPPSHVLLGSGRGHGFYRLRVHTKVEQGALTSAPVRAPGRLVHEELKMKKDAFRNCLPRLSSRFTRRRRGAVSFVNTSFGHRSAVSGPSIARRLQRTTNAEKTHFVSARRGRR